MKTTLILLCALLAAPFATAADTPPAPAREMASVEQFLSLSDAELDQMQQVIARVRAMTPAQRTELRREIGEYRHLPAPEREQLRRGWGWMPREIQDGWRDMMLQATPERRAEIQRELQSLTPAEKIARRRQMVEEFLRTKPAAKP